MSAEVEASCSLAWQQWRCRASTRRSRHSSVCRTGWRWAPSTLPDRKSRNRSGCRRWPASKRSAVSAPAAIDQAMKFYASIGKKPILLRKEVPGHVANRLQVALYREVLHLIEQGVLSVADADDAVSWGPGLRWGIMGPNLQFHLGGGAGGIKHFMEHIFDAMSPLFDALGNPKITPALKQ